MNIAARLNRLRGWERVWLVATAIACLAVFVFFLGDPAIYDSANLVGDAGDIWLAAAHAEWGLRCIPGTFRETRELLSVRFSCYSIMRDGLPALVGAIGVGMASFGALKIARWIAIGFATERDVGKR